MSNGSKVQLLIVLGSPDRVGVALHLIKLHSHNERGAIRPCNKPIINEDGVSASEGRFFDVLIYIHKAIDDSVVSRKFA